MFYAEESVGIWPGLGLPGFRFREIDLPEYKVPSESSTDLAQA